MANVMVNFRMDENLKKEMDKVCKEMGMNMSAALNIFAKTVVRERRIPFEVTTEPLFPSSASEDKKED